MKILIPETSILLTPKGYCFPEEIEYGTEILIVNQAKELVPHPIIEPIPEPKSYHTKTILAPSLTFTLIPNYKVHFNDELRDFNSLEIGLVMPILDKTFIKNFEKIQDELAEANSKTSPISPIFAIYLTKCVLHENQELVVFPFDDEQSARELGKKIQNELVKDIGGELSYMATRQNYHRYSYGKMKSRNHKLFFRNNEFYESRKKFNFDLDMIDNRIYSNGFYLFFNFLQNFLTDGYVHHIQHFIRDNNKLLFSLPWDSKIRKLLQNTCLIWNKYLLSFSENPNELQLIPEDIYKSRKIIYDIKDKSQKCYEIDIPFGSQIIIDFMFVKPFELSETEIEELEKYVTPSENYTGNINFEQIRRQLMSNLSRETSFKNVSHPFVKINQIVGYDASKLHMLGKFDRKGEVRSSTTRYGKTSSVIGFLSDDTGETKIKLWGDIVHNLQNGTILELVGAYVKNGILQNKRGGRVTKINPKTL